MNKDSASGRVKTHLMGHIAQGRPGDRVPSVREIIGDLGVSPGTVRSAVAELVRVGELETVSGSGTFIAKPVARRAERGDLSWQSVVLGPRGAHADVLHPLQSIPPVGTVDLASGYPDAELQPTQLIAKALRLAARRPGAFGRAPMEGVPELQDWFSAQLSPSRTHNVLVMPGGQAALSLIFRSLASPGDSVVMESPTYVGAIAAARAAGLVVVPAPIDDGGVIVEALEDAIDRSHARLVYLQPRFHNPTGVTLRADRRPALHDLADRKNLIIVEDDWLFDLERPSGLAPLAVDDVDGHVVHIRSLTKAIAPAVRIAGVAASGAIAQRLKTLRSVEDFFVSPILQEAALNVVTDPAWQRHLRQLGKSLAERQRALRFAVDEFLPDEMPVISAGPLHIWVAMPPGLDPDALCQVALGCGVAITPGTNWHPGDAAMGHIRLSNASTSIEGISLGVERLADAVGAIVTS